MQFNRMKIIILFFLVLSISACNGFFEKDNVPPPKPLVTFKPQATPVMIWSNSVGSGVGGDYLKLRPSVDADAIYAVGRNGSVSAINKRNGRAFWKSYTNIPITTGPGLGDRVVVVGSSDGDIVALRKDNGRIIWRKKIPAEILAKPAVANGIVIIKTNDGALHAYAAEDGKSIWSFQQDEPNLLLRGSSTPLINHHTLIVGFASGSLAKINLQNGRLEWLETIAVPEGAFGIQRMVDIDADPILFNHHIYAATYQGKIASVNWHTGQIIWSRDLSSYTGMVADEETIYVTDADSHILALDASSGEQIWLQKGLEARGVTGPASMGPYIVVGDAEGYLHWVNKSTGRFAARINAGYAMNATPVVDQNVLYAMTNNGNLIAYTLR